VRRNSMLLRVPAATQTLEKGLTEILAVSAMLRDRAQYPHLVNQQPDLYRGFIERSWQNHSGAGVIALIHPESHFTEVEAVPLRKESYRRLRRHWQFVNAEKLFEIDAKQPYSISIYGPCRSLSDIRFNHTTSAIRPETILDSIKRDGAGVPPSLKNSEGKWNLAPHRERIQTITLTGLKAWRRIQGSTTLPPAETQMVYTLANRSAEILLKLAQLPRRSELGFQVSSGWNETTGKKKGLFDKSWQIPRENRDVILKNKHFAISNPLHEQPNQRMSSTSDWSPIDLEAIPDDFLPSTIYFRQGSLGATELTYPTW